jgi:hypothetical protein
VNPLGQKLFCHGNRRKLATYAYGGKLYRRKRYTNAAAAWGVAVRLSTL